ncbi:MAG TPA: S-layer homology domain-containing protein, partial [Chloroflexia bacterium]|nr:S-layer homology domain-containing protein [Chloroflexia bacterium]
MSGYRCGTNADEECDEEARAYFRPAANATRAQLAKIVSNAAGLVDEVEGQTFADVPPPAQEGDPSSFYLFVERLAQRGVIGGYPCGGPGEKCDGENRPFFRPGDSVTRGQAAKIVANTFFPNCQTYPTTLTCDTSGDRNGESTPSAGRVDDILTFTARGFAPGENVGYWFTTPDGQVFGTDTPSDGFTSSEEGTVGPIRLRIPAEFVESGTGQWSITFQGEQSNNLAVIHFCIYP